MAVCALARNAPEQVFGDYPGNTCFKLFFATNYTDFHEFLVFSVLGNSKKTVLPNRFSIQPTIPRKSNLQGSSLGFSTSVEDI